MGKYYYIYWHLTDMKSLTGGVFYFQQWLRLSLPFSRGHHFLAGTDTLGNLEWSGLSWLGDFDKPGTGTVRELRAPLTLFPTRFPSIPSLGGLLLFYFRRQSAFSLARHLGIFRAASSTPRAVFYFLGRISSALTALRHVNIAAYINIP
jgi:hypothetical protein